MSMRSGMMVVGGGMGGGHFLRVACWATVVLLLMLLQEGQSDPSFEDPPVKFQFNATVLPTSQPLDPSCANSTLAQCSFSQVYTPNFAYTDGFLGSWPAGGVFAFENPFPLAEPPTFVALI